MSASPNPQAPWLLSQLKASVDPGQFGLALRDLTQGARRWPLWGFLGYHEIRQRYRRSVLGPLWITISMGVMILALGLLYGAIFRLDLADYLPYLTLGFIIWGLLSSFITDGLQVFIKSDGFIRQMAAPLSVHVYKMVWSNLIIFAHNLLVFVLIALWFQVPVGWGLLIAPLALTLLVVNGVWIGLLLGLLSARFRDIPLIVANVVQVLFFLTPIVWKPDMLPGKTPFVDANPLFHLVEILRGPLLGQPMALESWVFVGGITLVGWALTLLALTAYRWRIPYWV